MKRSRLLWGAALVAGVVSASIIALPAAPANAVPTTTLVSNVSATSSTTTKTVTVNCPIGHPFLYGPSGGITIVTGTIGSVALKSVVPVGNPPTGASVTATELGTFAGTWNVTVFAICGPFTTELQVVPDSEGPNTQLSKEAAVSCPTGLGLYGTGFRLTGDGGNVLVHDVIPGTSVSPRGVTVRATTRTGTPSWQLEAFGICATRAPTMRVEQASTIPNSNQFNSVSRTCQTAGTRAHGVGVQTFGDTGVDGRIALTTMALLSTFSGGAIAAENVAVAESWRVQVYVICSN
jgi:hypothetical protein